VEDDLRSLSEIRGNIYLGWTLGKNAANGFVVWHEGRLQQSNDGQWLFRSSSSDGSIVAFQLRPVVDGNWSSSNTPREGIVVSYACIASGDNQPIAGGGDHRIGWLQLRQQLPQEVTN
jgi:hypothetical protein